MAAITSISGSTQAAITLGMVTLTASDTLTYKPLGNQKLFLYNPTASPVVVTIDGNGGTTLPVSGIGGTIDVSAGKAITVPANDGVYVVLKVIDAYLQGATVAVTGGTGLKAKIVEG